MKERLKSLLHARIAAHFALALCLSASCLLAPQSRARSFVQAARGVGSDEATAGELSATREGRLRLFDEVWSLVRERYYDPRLRGLDWDALGARARVRAADADDEAELYAEIRRLLAALRDPHTRVFPPGAGADWRLRSFVSVGVSVREVSDELIVSEVERGGDAWRAGVRSGDLLMSVDGIEAGALLARRTADQPFNSRTTARRLAVASIFDGAADTSVETEFRRERRVMRVVLKRMSRTRKPEFSARRLGGGIRLVSFNLFTAETVAQLARSLGGELKDTRALILDLRDNGGGDAEAMTDAASIFLPAGVELGAFTDRGGHIRLAPRTRAALLSSADSMPRFTRRVLILTSARTASAAEIFAASLGEAGRASILGEATCGCVLGIRRRHTLPDGGTLDISENDYHTSRGVRLEGAGVAPDQTIIPAREDIRAGRDAVLIRAVETLRRAGVR